MKLLIMVDDLKSIGAMMRVIQEKNYESKIVGVKDELVPAVCAFSPDALVVACVEMEDRTLREVAKVDASSPLPIIIFTHSAEVEIINRAVKCGASAYVIDCDDPARLESLLEVARARFQESENLKQELQRTKTALEDRKVIEKAKGIIMKSRSLSEEQAYSAMRKLAMNQNQRLSEVANQVIQASKVLVR